MNYLGLEQLGVNSLIKNFVIKYINIISLMYTSRGALDQAYSEYRKRLTDTGAD